MCNLNQIEFIDLRPNKINHFVWNIFCDQSVLVAADDPEEDNDDVDDSEDQTNPTICSDNIVSLCKNWIIHTRHENRN